MISSEDLDFQVLFVCLQRHLLDNMKYKHSIFCYIYLPSQNTDFPGLLTLAGLWGYLMTLLHDNSVPEDKNDASLWNNGVMSAQENK